MRRPIKLTLLVSALTAAALAAGSDGTARQRSHNDRYRSIATTPATGGYCDPVGCPDYFWRYPIHYGPVFSRGQWYRGPVYYRGDRWTREYWVRGGWHRDDWRGRRPDWARASHNGPPLPYEYYRDHGFALSDHWRYEHDADRGGQDTGSDRGDHGGDGHRDHGAGSQGGDNEGDRHHDWHATGDHRSGDQGRTSDNGRADNGPGDRHVRIAEDQGGDRGGQAPGNSIHVTMATYGATCHQPAGNVTRFLSDTCDGKSTCDYVVRYQTIGDPAPGCAKDFSVQWTCSAGPGGSAGVPAEAGLGSRVSLQCLAPRP